MTEQAMIYGCVGAVFYALYLRPVIRGVVFGVVAVVTRLRSCPRRPAVWEVMVCFAVIVISVIWSDWKGEYRPMSYYSLG